MIAKLQHSKKVFLLYFYLLKIIEEEERRMHNNFWKKCFSVFVALLMIFSNAQNLVYAEGDGSSNSSTEDYKVIIQNAQYWNVLQ